MQLSVNESLIRPPLWSKERFVTDLKQNGGKVRAACRTNSDESTSWRALYNDVWKWRRLDKEFDKEVSALVTRTAAEGRPPLDGGDTSWYIDYCTALRNFNGNWRKAAEASPYSIRQINEFLDPSSSSFRKEFYDLVSEIFLEVAGDLQEMFFSLREEHNWESFEAVKIAQQKAWVALKGLEKLDASRWGRKAEINVSGSVQHIHKNEPMDKQALLASLWEERNLFFAKKEQLRLESMRQEAEAMPVIEAEVVEIVENREV